MTNEKDLKEKLTPEEYYVTQNHGTEPAFSGKYDGVKTPGTYHCIVCGVELFSSESKLSLIHISEPTRPRLISYAVF